MLRMVFVGLFIPLGIGVLAAMELRTPPRPAPVVVPSVAETSESISESAVALAKGDRLEIAAASIETPAQPAPVEERISPPEDISVGPSEPPRVNIRPRHDPKPRKVAAATRPEPKSKPKPKLEPKLKPKTTIAARTIVSERRKASNETEPCRLSAFGGLRKALNSLDCEI